MAINILNNLDLNLNEIQNVFLHNLDNDPASGSAGVRVGRIYYNSKNHVIRYLESFDSSSVAVWKTVATTDILDGLNWADDGNYTGMYVQKVVQSKGKITVTHAQFSPSIDFNADDPSTPKAVISVGGATSATKALPVARVESGTAYSGIVNVGAQTFTGQKTFTSSKSTITKAAAAFADATVMIKQDLAVDGSILFGDKLYFGKKSLALANAPYLELVQVDDEWVIHTNASFYSDKSVSAGGIGTGGSGGGGGVEVFSGAWSSYTSADAGKALAAALGKDLHDRVSVLESSGALTFTTTGSGNAVTSITKSSTTVTVTKGKTFLEASARGAANGVAPLDENSKIALSYLPDTVLGQLVYGGLVNAGNEAILSSNAKKKLGVTSDKITLSDTGTYGYAKCEGLYFLMTDNQSGTASLPKIDMQKGDWLISTGTTWGKVDNTDAVTSVNNKTGAVNLTLSDIVTGADSIVTSFGGKTMAITVRSGSTTNGQVNFSMNENELQGSVVLANWALAASKPSYNATELKLTSAYAKTTGNLASGDTLQTAFGKLETKADKALAALTHTYTITNSNLDSNHSYTTANDFASANLVMILYDSSDNVVMTDMKIKTNSSTSHAVTVTFASAITATYRLVVIGI